MTTNDIKVIAMPGGTREFKVDDRNTGSVARTIKAGEPANECTNYVTRVADDDPNIDTAGATLVGIAASESTETATANGVVNVTMLIPCVTVLRGAASTVANVDSESELLAYLHDDVMFGASATIYNTTTNGIITIDEDDDDVTNHGLKIIGGSADADGELDVIVKARWMMGGSVA